MTSRRSLRPADLQVFKSAILHVHSYETNSMKCLLSSITVLRVLCLYSTDSAIKIIVSIVEYFYSVYIFMGVCLSIVVVLWFITIRAWRLVTIVELWYD